MTNQERIEGNNSTIVTPHGDRISFGTYIRNGYPAHDRVVLRYNGDSVDLDAAMLATIVDGVVPGLAASYAPLRLPEASLRAIDTARGLLGNDVANGAYRDALVDMIHDLEPWPEVEGGDDKRDIIESLLRKPTMQTFIAQLHDRGSLAKPITWRTPSIAEARELLVNVGAWQSSPDGGGDILLTDSASVTIYDDAPPFHADDDLAARIEGAAPRVTFTIGPRGGIRRHV